MISIIPIAATAASTILQEGISLTTNMHIGLTKETASSKISLKTPTPIIYRLIRMLLW